MAAYGIGQAIGYFHPVVYFFFFLWPPCVADADITLFFLFLLLLLLSSHNLSGRRLDVYHTSTPVSYTHLTLPTIYSV